MIVKHEDGSTATVVQTGCYGRAVGLLQLTFDKDGVVKSHNYALNDITAKTAQAEDLKAYIDKVSEPFQKLTREIFGSNNPSGSARNAESVHVVYRVART